MAKHTQDEATLVEYEQICLPKPGTRILKTKPYSTELSAVGGMKITRIIDAPLDYFLVEGPEVIDGVVEIPFVSVLKAVRKKGSPMLVLRGGKANAAQG
jgi:hypothetical protein